jgi:hypothetical protein
MHATHHTSTSTIYLPLLTSCINGKTCRNHLENVKVLATDVKNATVRQGSYIAVHTLGGYAKNDVSTEKVGNWARTLITIVLPADVPLKPHADDQQANN